NLTARIIQKGLPSPASRWTPSTSLATRSTESGTTRYIPPKRIPSQSKQLSSDEALACKRPSIGGPCHGVICLADFVTPRADVTADALGGIDEQAENHQQ